MNIASIRRAVQRGLGFRTDLAAEILEVVNEVRDELDADVKLGRPWFLLSEVANTATTIGDHRVKIPADYLGIEENFRLYYYNGAAENVEDKWTPIPKIPLNWARELEPGETGSPKYYDLKGDEFWIFPLPDAAYTVKMMYYGKTLPYTSDTDERDWIREEPQLVIAKTTLKLAKNLRDMELIQIAEADSMFHWDQARIRIIARDVNGQMLTMGGDD